MVGIAASTSSRSGSCQYLALSTDCSRASWSSPLSRRVVPREARESATCSNDGTGFSQLSPSEPPERVASSPSSGSRSYPSQKTAVLMSGSSSIASSRHRRRPRGPSRSDSASVLHPLILAAQRGPRPSTDSRPPSRPQTPSDQGTVWWDQGLSQAADLEAGGVAVSVETCLSHHMSPSVDLTKGN